MVQYGEEAIKEGMPSGPPSGMEDLFSMFTGGMGGRRGAPRERRGENVVHRLKVGLEEMYIGSTRCAGRPVGSVGAAKLRAYTSRPVEAGIWRNATHTLPATHSDREPLEA